MRKNMVVLMVIAIVMLALPWGTVAFASHDAGMAISFLLFFGVNPLCSMYVGIWSGLAAKERWYLPCVNPAAFLLGVWTGYDWGNPDFYGYAIAYLVVGFLAMVVTVFVVRGIRKELNA